jgi:hypothetical protein
MHPDHQRYLGYCSRSNLIKSIESLAGLVEGIDIDREINTAELGFLYDWIDSHEGLRDKHPFNEVLPVLVHALEDGILTDDEKEDLLWLCSKVTDERFADIATADMRRLHGVLGGITADALITPEELKGLREWLDDHDHMKSLWPYDEVDALVTTVMADGRVTPEEHELLGRYFSEFVGAEGRSAIEDAPFAQDGRIDGVCASCPEVTFEGKVFCLTGASARYLREELVEMITGLGGQHSKSVTRKVDYLVVGADGNPCWAYACYGRKVEAAVKLRKQGFPLWIVHENDLRDALAEHGV